MRTRREQLAGRADGDERLLRSRMLRMAELEARKARLAAKREVVGQVFDAVLGGMQSMPGPQRMAFNRRLLLEVAGGGAILCAEEDAELFPQAFLDDVNAELARRGKGPVRLGDERRETGGGFILKDGALEIDCRYARILVERRLSLEADVAAILFDEREVR